MKLKDLLKQFEGLDLELEVMGSHDNLDNISFVFINDYSDNCHLYRSTPAPDWNKKAIIVH